MYEGDGETTICVVFPGGFFEAFGAAVFGFGVAFGAATFVRGIGTGVLFALGAAAFDFGAVFWTTLDFVEGVFFFETTGTNLEAPSSDVVEPSSSRRFDSFPDDEDFDA